MNILQTISHSQNVHFELSTLFNFQKTILEFTFYRISNEFKILIEQRICKYSPNLIL